MQSSIYVSGTQPSYNDNEFDVTFGEQNSGVLNSITTAISTNDETEKIAEAVEKRYSNCYLKIL